MKIILFGASGKVGSGIKKVLDMKKYRVDTPRSQEINLLNFFQISKYIKDLEPDIVINAAGYNLGPKITQNESIFEMNNSAIANLILACEKVKTLIHIGSASIYQGLS